ncbi:MAG: hypothetical protein ABIR54_21485 [Burkholderiaceae bacterium]
MHATILLALEGRALGLEHQLEFLRWEVTNDPSFREHWALGWRGREVLDMSAAQIDADPRPLRVISSYPANYVRMRGYPLAPILACVESGDFQRPDQYSRTLMLRLHRCLMQIDVLKSVRSFSPSGVIAASMRLASAAFVLAAGHVLERALQRLSRILNRLN